MSGGFGYRLMQRSRRARESHDGSRIGFMAVVAAGGRDSKRSIWPAYEMMRGNPRKLSDPLLPASLPLMSYLDIKETETHGCHLLMDLT